ncbi:MAG: MATE family efflux transporter [Chloroflexi bacterium]|nr:MATE family efflux transporter [Chloroflexota bacterium]
MADTLASTMERVALRHRVLRLSWPAVAEQWLNVLVGLVTIYLVGHLGAAPLAAVGLGEQVMQIAIALFTSIGVGSTAIIARHVGARELHLVGLVVQQSFVIATVIGVASSGLVVVFAESIFTLFRSEPDVVNLGAAYLRIAGGSLFLSSLLFVGAAILRGAGDTRTPMLVMLAVNATNVVLSLALIYGALGIPALGVTGAGLASALSRGIGGFLMVWLVVRGRGYVQSDLLRRLSVDTKQIGRILNVGIPAGLETLQTNAAQIVFAMIISSLGTAQFAAHVVAMRIETIAITPGFGFGIAAATLVGQALGAGRPDLAKRSGYLSQVYALAVVTTLGVGLFVFAEQISAFFVNDPAVVAQTITLTRIMAAAAPAIASLHVFSGSLRGAGDTRWVMFIMLVCLWAGRVSAGFLLATVAGFGVAGAWIAMVGDMYARGGLLWRRFASGKWQKTIV